MPYSNFANYYFDETTVFDESYLRLGNGERFRLGEEGPHLRPLLEDIQALVQTTQR